MKTIMKTVMYYQRATEHTYININIQFLGLSRIQSENRFHIFIFILNSKRTLYINLNCKREQDHKLWPNSLKSNYKRYFRIKLKIHTMVNHAPTLYENRSHIWTNIIFWERGVTSGTFIYPKQTETEFELTLTGRARGFAAWSTMLKTTEEKQCK